MRTTQCARLTEGRWLRAWKEKIHLGFTWPYIFSPWWFTILLLAVPAGIALNYTHKGAVAVFVVNFIAICPCTRIVIRASDELMSRTGDFTGVLIGVTFRNAAQLILSTLLLKSRQLATLQTSLLGSLLANNVLMLPLGFLLGGWNRIEQFYNITTIRTSMSLSLLSTGTLLIMTIAARNQLENTATLAKQSRGASVVMLLVYIAFLWFGLRSHYDVFNEPSLKVIKRDTGGERSRGDAKAVFAAMGGLAAATTGGQIGSRAHHKISEDEEDSKPKMVVGTILLSLAIFTALLAICTQFATDNLQGLINETAVTQTFAGLILLPLLTVDPSTVKAAMEDKQDVNINSNLGANIQSSLGVLPFMVLLGWMLKIEFTLVFSLRQMVEVALSSMLVLYVTESGKSNWTSGVLLIGLYVMIALEAFYTP